MKAGGRAPVGRGPRRLPFAGRPARAPPLWRSRSLHLRRLVPGAGRCCRRLALLEGTDLKALGHNSADYVHHADRGAEARLRRPRGLLRRPGVRRGAAADADLVGIRRRAAQADRPEQGVAGNAAARRARRCGARGCGAQPAQPVPRARHLLCLRRRPLGQSVLGDAERRLLRLADGAGHRAHPVDARLAVAPRPAPPGRRRARQAAAPDARTRRWRSRARRAVHAVRHARRRRADPGDAAGPAQRLCPRAGRAERDREPALCQLQLSRRPLRPTTIIPGRLSIEGRIPEAVDRRPRAARPQGRALAGLDLARRRGLRDPGRQKRGVLEAGADPRRAAYALGW